jgi:hypothetical protein
MTDPAVRLPTTPAHAPLAEKPFEHDQAKQRRVAGLLAKRNRLFEEQKINILALEKSEGS